MRKPDRVDVAAEFSQARLASTISIALLPSRSFVRRILTVFVILAGSAGCSLIIDTPPYQRARDASLASCGDRTVDQGERCDDGNAVSGDGCERGTCTYTCERAADCSNGNDCDGEEICDSLTHVCLAGTPLDVGAPCTVDGADGTCRAADVPTCVPAGCGNMEVDGTEECDDGNDITGDGCEDDCTWSCTDDIQCDDRDPCNGAEFCVDVTHTCEHGTSPTCDDSNGCTEDTCDALGCRHTVIDDDGDGYSPPSATCDDLDCDDHDPLTYPGAAERCEEAPLVDNDCDGSTGDNPTSSAWYRDCDEDGYAPAGAVTSDSCTEPALSGGCGWTARQPVNGTTDCDDTRSDVFPHQSMYFSTPLATGSTDDARFGNYDCDAVAQYAHPRDTVDPTATCTPSTNLFGGLICDGAYDYGWVSSAPACGEEGTLTSCTPLTTCADDTCATRTDCRRFCLRPFGQSCSADCMGPNCRWEYRCCSRVSTPTTETCH